MRHASLFSGIGGPEVAAAMLGWENAFHCEINPFGRAVLEYWFPESKSYEDITKASFKEWRGRIDVLTGGFPCQPFSYAGKRGGREDERYLWPEMLRVIDEVRPTWVVGENVAGITTMVEGGVLADLGGGATLFSEGDELHRYELDQSFTIERICRDLERLGYSVQPVLVPAAAVGAPHRRDRVFIIAHDDATDADCRHDGREAGGHEGEGEGERVRERDEVRQPGIADKVRSEDAGTDTDSISDGCPRDGKQEILGRWDIDPEHHAESKIQDILTDTYLQRFDERLDSSKSRKKERLDNKEDSDWRTSERMEPGKRWDTFPTVSPVHRGNDGLPFPVDDLAIPQTRWRFESLKAYGNAIVPQVMYRIFQAIDEN